MTLFINFSFTDKYLTHEPRIHSTLAKDNSISAENNFNFVQSWLRSVHVANPEDADSANFVKLKNNLRKHASALYLNTDSQTGNSFVSEDYSESNDDPYSAPLYKDPYLRYRSCENLNFTNKRTPVVHKRFHKSSESLFYNKTKPEPKGEFFLHHLDHCPVNDVEHIIDINLRNKLYGNINDDETNEPDYQSSDSEGFEDIEMSAHSLKDYYNLNIDSEPKSSDIENRNLPTEKSTSSSSEDGLVETDSLDGSADDESTSVRNHREDLLINPTDEDDIGETPSQVVIPSFAIPIETISDVEISPPTQPTKDQSMLTSNSFNEIVEPPEMATSSLHPEKSNLTKEDTTSEPDESINRLLFDELKALYELAKQNLEFLIISNNDASIQIDNPSLPTVQRMNNVIDKITEVEPAPEPVLIVNANDPQVAKNYLSKAYIEISPSINLSNNPISLNDQKYDPVIKSNTFDDPDPPAEELQSDSDDNFEDVDNKESTESNFISENSSDNDESFVEEEEEVEEELDERIDKAFHEALAENIKEYIEREASEIETKRDIVADPIEPIKPVVLNPPANPVHIIRINIPDDLINAPKRDQKLTIRDIQSQVAILSDNDDAHPIETKSSNRTENINDTENPINGESSLLFTPSPANFLENKTDEENIKSNEVSNEIISENESSSESSEKGSFSEYIREVVITRYADSTDNELSEEDKQPAKRTLDGYSSDASDNSFKV